MQQLKLKTEIRIVIDQIREHSLVLINLIFEKSRKRNELKKSN